MTRDPDTGCPVALEELLNRVRVGHEPSLRRLVDEHGGLVYGIALRITCSAVEAEDVVQNVFVGLPEALAGFDGRNFRGWLAGITTRQAYLRLRDEERHRRLALHVRAFVQSAHEPSPENRVLERTVLETALARLSPELRGVFVLKAIEGLSHAEVADALGLTVGSSRVRLHRARQELRKLLGP